MIPQHYQFSLLNMSHMCSLLSISIAAALGDQLWYDQLQKPSGPSSTHHSNLYINARVIFLKYQSDHISSLLKNPFMASNANMIKS